MKQRSDELVLFGGRPAFDSPLHVGRPNIGRRERLHSRLDEALDRCWLTNDGPFVRELEGRLAELLEVRHVIAVANATLGLQLATRALGLSGEVIVPSFTFVATAHALSWEGVKPVFCDVDAKTHCIDPVCAEALITERTTGILGVHLWGGVGPVDALSELAARRNLRLMFDAAHAFACSRGTRMVGSFGDAEIFSFHATKFFNTFEGGSVATNNSDLARDLRLLRNFGFSGEDAISSIGINAKMSEPCAAMGLTGLDSLDEFLSVNRANYESYARALAGIPGIKLFAFDPADRPNYQYVVVEIDQDEAGLSRDELATVLRAENVLARRYFYPGCHRAAPYRDSPAKQPAVLPVTEALAAGVLALPTGTAVTQEAIVKLAAILRVAIGEAPRVRRHLREVRS